MPADAALSRLDAAQAWAGITRIAELTHLDRIGLPVFQAVRPLGRALSVHQGKGADNGAARLSAIMEAVESAAAERAVHSGPTCGFRDLPAGGRARAFGDYGARLSPGDESRAMRWQAAEDLVGGGILFVPFEIVSLDFTAAGEGVFLRSSEGLGAGATIADATAAAILEIIERPAQAEWLASGLIGQASRRIDNTSIALDWFQKLLEHARSLGLRLSVYALYGAGGLPVVTCRIDEAGRAPSCIGTACRPDPCDALFRAFAEAAQSRLTIISGARDDIGAAEGGQEGRRALGTPPGFAAVHWDAYCAGFGRRDLALPERLAAGGFARIARVDLTPACGGASIVKLIIPGLSQHAEVRKCAA